MKVKLSFSLVVLLIVFLSVGMVAASENITENMDNQQAEDILGVEDVPLKENSPEIPANNESSSAADLYVNVKTDSNNVDRGDIVIWTITVQSQGGMAKNTVVQVSLSSNLKYIDSSADAGSFNPNNGTWNVGDLEGLKSLKIKTEALYWGELGVDVFASANFDGESPISDAATARIICSSKPGPVSKPDDNKRHQPHYLSSHSSSFRVTTKALSNVSAKAKIDMKPAGNPILIALLSLTTLFAIKFKKD